MNTLVVRYVDWSKDTRLHNNELGLWAGQAVCLGSTTPVLLIARLWGAASSSQLFSFAFTYLEMSTAAVVFGLTATGELLTNGLIIESTLQSSSSNHHFPRNSSSQFEAESWSGEHEEESNHDEERRASLYAGQAESVDHAEDADTPIASSGQFERKRTASLAAALLEVDPKGIPLVSFFRPDTEAPLLEAEEEEANASDASVEAGEAETVLSQLLFTLKELKMTNLEKHQRAVQRLKELEAELRAADAVTPPDQAVSDAVARALALAGEGRDVQIRVNQSRHTTTTKTVYETETPGMVGLDEEKIRELQKQMLESLCRCLCLIRCSI